MFDKLKAAAGVAGLLKDLPRVQARVAEVKEELKRIQCTGHSGCRHVRAVVNAHMELLSVDIDPKALEPAGVPREALQKAVADAVNDAFGHARREAAQRMADAAQELGIPIPAQFAQLLQQG